jgi:prolipoprotein diacylglyceryl transferase
MIASIPSPGTGVLDVGPLTIHMYGLMLLLAIVACIGLTGIRWTRMGGDWDLVLRVAVWGVAAGVVGARLYHDVTSWSEVPDPKWRGIFAVWEGGLGVWGGILFGCLAGAVVIHRSGESVARFLDAAAPGLLLAQGIGRLGNWWNQELFGKPTDRPWALEIDPEHRTFLYELAWDVAGVVLLLLLARRFRFRPPALFALYISYYCFGRFFEELLRIDPAHEIGPLRLNAWVSIVVFVLSTAFFIWWQFLRRERRERGDRPRPAPRGPKMAIPKGRVRQRG